MEEIKLGATRFYINRTHDSFGNKLAEPQKEEVVCGDCRKMWTITCPIRVASRTKTLIEKPVFMKSTQDVDPERDYCSRFEFKEETE